MLEGLIGKVILKCKALPTNVAEILQNNLDCGKVIISKVVELRSVAFLCLQNILQNFDAMALGGGDRLSEIYITLKKALTETTGSGYLMPVSEFGEHFRFVCSLLLLLILLTNNTI